VRQLSLWTVLASSAAIVPGCHWLFPYEGAPDRARAADGSPDRDRDLPAVHSWSRRAGGLGEDIARGVAIDADGNVTITGSFAGSVDFGGGALSSGGGWDIFVASYDSTGAHRWSKRFGGVGEDGGSAVAVDASGNVTVTGVFYGKVDFGAGALTSAGAADIFVASFDPTGAHRWSKGFGAANDEDAGRGVAVDKDGNTFITGVFVGKVDFGGGALQSNGGDVFLASYGPSGVYRWAKSFAGTAWDDSMAVAVDGDGNVAVTGIMEGTINFGGAPLATAGGTDIFVASFDAKGTHRWSSRFGSTGDDFGLGVAADSGNVFVTGTFEGAVDFGGGALQSAGLADVFVASYGPTGTHRWSRRFGGTDMDEGYGAAVDGAGNVIVAGQFQISVDCGGLPLTALGGTDIFVASYESAGTPRWSTRFGGKNLEEAFAVAANGRGTVAVAGEFNGTANLGGPPLTSAGSGDVFVLQIAP